MRITYNICKHCMHYKYSNYAYIEYVDAHMSMHIGITLPGSICVRIHRFRYSKRRRRSHGQIVVATSAKRSQTYYRHGVISADQPSNSRKINNRTYLKQFCSLPSFLGRATFNSLRQLACHRSYVEHQGAFFEGSIAHTSDLLCERVTPCKFDLS